ncbi:MAG: hypothetical protein ABSG95_03575 [Solirubrobacteraceae bacterium]
MPRERPARPDAQREGIALGLIAALNGLSRHRLLARLADRISVGGRTWIALVAFALIGIVTLQLGLLKLNASIGRALEREALLQRQNASLSIENSEVAAGDRIEARATSLGMELAPAGALRFLAARPGIDAGLAAAALSSTFLSAGSGSGEASSAGSGSGEASSAGSGSGEVSSAGSGSGETLSAGSGSGQASRAGSGEAATSTASPSPGERVAPAASESSAGSSVSEGAEAPRRSPESTAGTTPSSAPSQQAATAPQAAPSPTPSSSAEASPGGGTQAGAGG